MQERLLFGVLAHACPTCAAIWFQDGALTELGRMNPQTLEAADALVQPQTPKPAPTGVKCPEDGFYLYTFQFAYDSGIELHQCPECGGILVEDGELAQMAEARQNPGDRPGRPGVTLPLPIRPRPQEALDAAAELDGMIGQNKSRTRLMEAVHRIRQIVPRSTKF